MRPEEIVNCFQSKPGRLRVERPDDGGDDDVERGKYDISAPANILQRWRRNLDNLLSWVNDEWKAS